MTKVPDEIKQNYQAFSTKLETSLVANLNAFRGNTKLIESYYRIAAINAIKIDLIEPNFPEGAAHFFFEAHNDALLSHTNASFGSWRPALQSLRSFMENTLAALYYLDHPVEFEKWKAGIFYITPKDLREYAAEHPKVASLAKSINIKNLLDREYGTLSKAVHGSNVLFRMTTSDGKTNIGNANLADLAKWSTRERVSIDVCLTVVVGILHEYLDGAKMPNLRGAMRLALLPNSKSALKALYNVNIPT